MISQLKFRRSWLQGGCALTSVLCTLLGHPNLAMIPLLGHSLLFFPSAVSAFKKLSSRHRLMATLSAFGLLSLMTSLPVHAIQFSFLLNSTQKAMETCIFNQITGLAVLSGVIFMAIRGGVMLGLAYTAFEGWQEKRKQQDASEQIKTIVYALVAILVVGAIEPLIIGGGCAVAA